MTGEHCRGIETWRIDDNTGAVTYEGSSLSNLSTQQPQRKLTDRARSDTPTNTPVRPPCTPIRPIKTPIPPTDYVRIEASDAQIKQNFLPYKWISNWRLTHVRNVSVSVSQMIVFYDKEKHPWLEDL